MRSLLPFPRGPGSLRELSHPLSRTRAGLPTLALGQPLLALLVHECLPGGVSANRLDPPFRVRAP